MGISSSSKGSHFSLWNVSCFCINNNCVIILHDLLMQILTTDLHIILQNYDHRLFQTQSSLTNEWD